MTQANDGNAPIPNSATPPAPAVPGWRIGVLYSRSGVSGTTESQHFFGTVLAVEEINALGGVLGRPLEPVVYDPRSESEEYRRLAGRLLLDDEVNVIFRRLHLALPQGHAAGGRAQQLAAVVRLGLRRFRVFAQRHPHGRRAQPGQHAAGGLPDPALRLAHLPGGRRLHLSARDQPHHARHRRAARRRDPRRNLSAAGLRPCRHQRGCRGHPPHPAGRGVLDADRLGRRALLPPLSRDGPVGRAHAHRQPDHDRGRGGPGRPGSPAPATSPRPRISPVDTPANAHFLARWRQRFGERPASVYAEASYSQVHLYARALQRAGSQDTRKLVQAVHLRGSTRRAARWRCCPRTIIAP